MTTARADLDAEREVDFGAYARTVGSRWWLLVAGVVAGALIGWLLSLGGGTVYRAKTTIYLGQPISPTGSQQIQSLATNPEFVNQVAKADSTVQTVADLAGKGPSASAALDKKDRSDSVRVLRYGVKSRAYNVN